MEAFSDGVIAIIITVMVLELKVPHGSNLEALRSMLPAFLSYVLSFALVGIYWSNHHHLLQAVHHVDGRILWANLHLLFWLSLTPFVTNWMGDYPLAPLPVAAYGTVMLLAGAAYLILARALVPRQGTDSTLAQALGRDRKGKVSLVIYLAAIPFAFVNAWVSCALYATVAVIWLVPDRRIEGAITQ